MSAHDVANELLTSRFKEFRDRPAFIDKKTVTSYSQFSTRVAAWDKRLRLDGVRPGESVGIAGSWSLESTALMFALAARKNIVAPVGGALEAVGARLDVAAVSNVYVIDNDSVALVKRKLPTLDGRCMVHPLIETLRGDREAGLVLFTCGTAGAGKTPLLSFDRLLERFATRRPPYRALAFLPFDHIGGINTALHALAHGGALVTLDERTPIAVSRAIERDKIELLPTTPTFLNMLVASGAIGLYNFQSLKTISYGAEPMPPSTLAALHKSLPGVKLKQTYGLSELGVLPTQSRDDASVWMKVGGAGAETQVRQGVLWVKAPSAMLGYLDAESPFDDDGWFNTGDAVETDGDFIHVLGRQSELLRINGDQMHPTAIESVLLEMPNVQDVVVYGRQNPVMGTVVAAVVSLKKPEDADAFERRMRDFAATRLPETRIPLVVETTQAPLHTERFKKQRTRGLKV